MRLKLEVEKYKRLRSEQLAMTNEDTLKSLIDNQVYRDKVDSFKLEVHGLKKENKKLRVISELYRDLKDKWD